MNKLDTEIIYKEISNFTDKQLSDDGSDGSTLLFWFIEPVCTDVL